MLDRLNPQGGFNGMNKDDTGNVFESMYQANKNWRTSVRAKPMRFPVQEAQSSLIEVLGPNIPTRLDFHHLTPH